MEPLMAVRAMEPDSAASPPGFIEVLDRAGHVSQRVALIRLPLFIGRAYNNDVILDDPYVSPIHLRLRQDGGEHLVAEDLGSVNGLYRDREKRRLAQVELAPNTEIRIGHTRLRYRDAHFAIPKTWVDFSASSLLSLLEKHWLQLLLYTLTLLWVVLGNYLQSVEKPQTLKMLAAVVPFLVVLVVWAGGWAFASRLIAHRLNFLIHAAIACAGLLLFSAINGGLEFLAFAFNGDGVEEALQLIGNAGIFGAMLYAHLRFCSHAPPRRLAVTASTLAGIAFCLFLLETQVDNSTFSSAPRFNTTLKPPAFQWVPSEPVATFFDGTASLRDRVQATARRK